MVKVVALSKVVEDGRIVWSDGKKDRWISPRHARISTTVITTMKQHNIYDVVVKHNTPENLAELNKRLR